MIPIMADTVTLHIKQYDANGQQLQDDWGQAVTDSIQTRARIDRDIKVTTDNQGTRRATVATIDVPADVNAYEGVKVTYADPFGKEVEGHVAAVQEYTMPMSNIINYRTLEIGQ